MRGAGITQSASAGPITRSRVDPAGNPLPAEPNPNRVVVSEQVDRNLEAASTFLYLPQIAQILQLNTISGYLSDDQPARICHRVRNSGRSASSSIAPSSPLPLGSPSVASSSSSSAGQYSSRSPTRRAAASSSCPSPRSPDTNAESSVLPALSSSGTSDFCEQSNPQLSTKLHVDF